MKALESEEILSDEIFDAIKRIISQTPHVVFGGSIALNAVGLLNRKVKDIDLFLSTNESLTKNGLLLLENIGETTSDTVTDINGVEIQRTGMKIGDVKICCFKVSDDQLQHSKHTFTRNGNTITICIQNVNYVIEAKKTYSNYNPKHEEDLECISTTLDTLF